MPRQECQPSAELRIRCYRKPKLSEACCLLSRRCRLVDGVQSALVCEPKNFPAGTVDLRFDYSAVTCLDFGYLEVTNSDTGMPTHETHEGSLKLSSLPAVCLGRSNGNPAQALLCCELA